jgi:tetratricopeptide (TPR) repeat protein
MRRGIRRFLGVFAALLAVCGPAWAQFQGGADWDQMSREYRGSQGAGSSGAAGPSVPQAARNATIENLNRILSTSQLSPIDRSLYLSIRAFAYSRLGREADSQKDVAEMAKVNPQGWPLVLSLMMPGLAGGGDRGAALRALGYGLAKKPNDSWLLIGQAQVQMQIADFARALGTLDSALAGAQTAGERRNAAYFRGHANLAMGNFQQSADDFEASIAGQTTLKGRIWGALWRYAAQVRGRHDARAALAKDIGNENLYEWPGPIAKFLLGRLPAGELEVAAESDDGAKRSNGKCMAAYFIGMDAVRRGDKQRAREQLQLAQARCPTVSEYNWAASNELKRL